MLLAVLHHTHEQRTCGLGVAVKNVLSHQVCPGLLVYLFALVIHVDDASFAVAYGHRNVCFF